MVTIRVTNSRDIHHPDFILRHRPRSVTCRLPYIVSSDYLTPQSAGLREACSVGSGELIVCSGANSGNQKKTLNTLLSPRCMVWTTLSRGTTGISSMKTNSGKSTACAKQSGLCQYEFRAGVHVEK